MMADCVLQYHNTKERQVCGKKENGLPYKISVILDLEYQLEANAN